MRIGEDLKEIILRSLVGKTGAEARRTIESLSASTGLSVGHIYRISGEIRPTARAKRLDAGKRRLDIQDTEIEAVQRIKIKYGIPTERSIEIARLNGAASENLSTAFFNRHQRQEGITTQRLKEDREPTVLYEAEEANAIHHFDASKMEHLHYDPITDQVTFDPRRNYKNSRGEKAQPVWLYLMVDDFSRAEFAFLYLDLNHFNHLDFIYRCWAQKENPSENPFYGIPRHLYMDKGGGNQSLKFLSALGKLGVHVIPTTPSTQDPHGARKHGKVESAFKFYNAWEREFQMSRPLSWEEAQGFLYERMLWRNRRRHTQTGQVPFQRWLRVEQPHHVPGEEFYRTLCYDRWTREVDGALTISLDGEMYKLPELRPSNNWVGEKVQVYAERGSREQVICVRDGKEVIAKKVTRDNLVRPAFHYKRDSEPTSIAEARMKATGTDDQPMKLWESASNEKAPAYLPRRGEQFDNSKIKLEGPPPAKEPEPYRPAPQRDVTYWLTRLEAMRALVDLGAFSEGRRSEEDLNFINLLMNGRGKIEYDEVSEAAKKLKKAKAAESEGGAPSVPTTTPEE